MGKDYTAAPHPIEWVAVCGNKHTVVKAQTWYYARNMAAALLQCEPEAIDARPKEDDDGPDLPAEKVRSSRR